MMASIWQEEKAASITGRIAEQIVDRVYFDDERMDDIMVVSFKSGMELRIKYDWIYDCSVVEKGESED
jgi:hypothetical protein